MGMMLPCCYGLGVTPCKRDWRASGYDVDYASYGFLESERHGKEKKHVQTSSGVGRVVRPDGNDLKAWATEPPWMGGWSPYVSVVVEWEDRFVKTIVSQSASCVCICV